MLNYYLENESEQSSIHATLEEAVVTNERFDVEKIDNQWGEEQDRAMRFIYDSTTTLSELEDDLKKCRKNGKIKHKYRLCCHQIMKKGVEILDPVSHSTHKDCIDIVKDMKSVITRVEKEKIKFDKDDCIKNIDEYSKRLYKLIP